MTAHYTHRLQRIGVRSGNSPARATTSEAPKRRGALRDPVSERRAFDEFEDFTSSVSRLVRNRGASLTGLTTVNIDFMRMYRSQTNVVSRPIAGTGGAGYSLVGHHEVLIPLIAAAIVEGDR